METKDVILELRTKRGLSQDDLAEKVMVTRQAECPLRTITLWDVTAMVH